MQRRLHSSLKAAVACACALVPAVVGGSARAQGAAAPVPEEVARSAFTGVSASLEGRVEGVAIIKRYATGSGHSYVTGGPGAGIGVAGTLHFRAPIVFDEDGTASWLDFDLGVGETSHYVDWRDGDTAQSMGLAETEASALIGPRLMTGRLHTVGDRLGWTGYGIALQWTPTYVYFFRSEHLAPAGRMNPAGLRVSLDFGRLTPGRGFGSPLFTVSLGWLPFVNDLPTIVSAGVGCAFY